MKTIENGCADKRGDVRQTLHQISTTCHHPEQETSPFPDQVYVMSFKRRGTSFSLAYKNMCMYPDSSHISIQGAEEK